MPFLTMSGISARSRIFSSGISAVLMPPRSAASSFSLRPPDRQHPAPQGNFARHGDVVAHRNTGHHRHDRRGHADTRRWPVLGGRPFRHVHVHVAGVEDRRLDAEIDRARAHIGHRRGDRFLHHLLDRARNRHSAPARRHHALDGQKFAAHRGPRQTGDQSDLGFGLDLAVTEDLRSEVLGQQLLVDHRLLEPAAHDVGDRLAHQLAEFTLEVPDPGLARVALDQRYQLRIRKFEFARLQPVLLEGLGDQVVQRDLLLFLLGVPRQPDDLHPVHQRRRDVQRVRRGDEHHVGKVVVDLEVVIVEGRVLLRVEHLQQRRGRVATEILPILSISSSRNNGLDLPAFLSDWITLPGIEPI